MCGSCEVLPQIPLRVLACIQFRLPDRVARSGSFKFNVPRHTDHDGHIWGLTSSRAPARQKRTRTQRRREVPSPVKEREGFAYVYVLGRGTAAAASRLAGVPSRGSSARSGARTVFTCVRICSFLPSRAFWDRRLVRLPFQWDWSHIQSAVKRSPRQSALSPHAACVIGRRGCASLSG